jgi:predicted GIY-YIG superfamily endonuclease
MTENYCVYLLYNNNNNKTYVGITNNLIRRLRQHNGELKGGARYTHNNLDNGKWLCYGTINNLSKSSSLSIERHIKNISKKYSGNPIDRRLKAINHILLNTNYLFILSSDHDMKPV